MVPKKHIILGVVAIIGLFVLWRSGGLTTTWQTIIGGLILFIILSSAKDEKELLEVREAKIIGAREFKALQKKGILDSGTMLTKVDGILRRWNGLPWFYEVACETESKVYVAEIDPYDGKVYGTKEVKTWSAHDAPHIQVVEPPTLMEYLKEKKKIEARIEEKVSK
jgi:hypothetical protein